MQADDLRPASYDPVARNFHLHRALPAGVPEAVRAAILRALDVSRPRVLDLGAGTGRIGGPFVAAGDPYIAVDLSLGMLREFARRTGVSGSHTPFLVQADGERLPFRDSSFDAVLLIQVIGAARSWQQLITEAGRVLLSDGALIIGQSVMPRDGLDAQMKQRLASMLQILDVPTYHRDVHRDVRQWLQSIARSGTMITAASWQSARSPRAFLERQQTGARFAALPEPVKNVALRQLRLWAAERFGSLDAVSFEQQVFELHVFRFEEARR